MRSSALLKLGIGLFSIGNVVASPCKPLSATTATSAATDSTTTSAASTNYSVTSSAVAETLTETSAAPTVETSDSSATIDTTVTSDALILTTAESTTAEPTMTETATTDVTTTTAAPTTDSTSNAPMPTFTMVVAGSGPVQGEKLQSENRENSVTAFKVNYPGWTARTYTIDSQGRLINDQGWFLCGRYTANNFELKKPAAVSLCSAETPLQAVFMNCRLSDGLEVQCSIPAISCVAGQDFFSFPTCVPADGTWDIFSLGQSGPGNTLQIGGSDGSAAYPALSIGIQKV